MQEKAKLKLNIYKIVQNAVETGMKFALNRLEDTTYEPITEFHKTSALPRMVVTMADGSKIEDELGVANAHPAGARPFARANYIKKFQTLTEGMITKGESDRFLDLVQRLPKLSAKEVGEINVVLDAVKLENAQPDTKGIF